MKKISIPQDALRLMQKIESHGESCWVVGGCVRDSLMGKQPSDWDMTTSATPEQMTEIFSDKQLLLHGEKHGTVGVIENNTVYEITTYRVEQFQKENSDHRHPAALSFTRSIEEDLKRRDFTVNAMAYHPQRGLLDCFNGCEDLKKGIIRCVGKAENRFEEDALRIVRALRFCSVLDFQPDDELIAAAEEKAELLKTISAERICVELCKLLTGKAVARILQLCPKVWKQILPQLSLRGKTEKMVLLPSDAVLRLCWLYQQENLCADEALSSLRFPADEIRRARQLFQIKSAQADTVYDFRVLLNRFPEQRIREALRIVAAENPIRAEEQKKLLQQAREGVFSLSQLEISGSDLLELGCPSGKAVGDLLKQLLEFCMEERLPNQRELLKEAADFLINRPTERLSREKSEGREKQRKECSPYPR